MEDVEVIDPNAPPGTLLTDGTEYWVVGGDKPKPEPEAVPTAPPARGFFPHQGLNRERRLAATAQMIDPKDEPGLRRKLLLQRKRRARGTMDVELRRLQRKAKRT